MGNMGHARDSADGDGGDGTPGWVWSAGRWMQPGSLDAARIVVKSAVGGLSLFGLVVLRRWAGRGGRLLPGHRARSGQRADGWPVQVSPLSRGVVRAGAREWAGRCWRVCRWAGRFAAAD
jgi:hypothetical protein